MTILYPAPRPVKPARTARRFGAGILASAPTYRVERTLEDEQWWAAECDAAESRRLDRLAAEAWATHLHERGLMAD